MRVFKLSVFPLYTRPSHGNLGVGILTCLQDQYCTYDHDTTKTESQFNSIQFINLAKNARTKIRRFQEKKNLSVK